MLAYAMLWRNDRARRQQGRRTGRTRQSWPGCHARPSHQADREAGAHDGGHAARCPDAAGARAAGLRPAPGRGWKDVARGSALNLVGALVAAVTTLALTVVITRQFSKPVAGAFFTAISLFLIVESRPAWAPTSALVNFIARLRRLGQRTGSPPSCARPSSRS